MTTSSRNTLPASASPVLPESLDQLMQQKASLLQEIREQKKLMAQTAHNLA